MIDSSPSHEPPPDHPSITPRGLLVAFAVVAAVPAALFAVEHPTAIATSLLCLGAVAAAIDRE